LSCCLSIDKSPNIPPGVTVRQKSDQTKKSAQPAAAKGSNTARVKAATYDGTSSWLDFKSHFDAPLAAAGCADFLV
jgi:hypothetical protein